MTAADGDAAQWEARAVVEKWSPEQTARAQALAGTDEQLSPEDLRRLVGAPDEVTEVGGNMLLTAGLARLVSLLAGAGGQALTNTATRLGVGNSSTAAAAGQTDLQAAAGAANRWFAPMDAGYPQIAGNVATFRATFGAGDGNFEWAEWGIDVDAPTVTPGATVGALLFNRKVAALGTKAAGAVWTLTTTVTIS